MKPAILEHDYRNAYDRYLVYKVQILKTSGLCDSILFAVDIAKNTMKYLQPVLIEQWKLRQCHISVQRRYILDCYFPVKYPGGFFENIVTDTIQSFDSLNRSFIHVHLKIPGFYDVVPLLEPRL